MIRSRIATGLLAGAASVSLAGVASIGRPVAAAAPTSVVFAATGAPQSYVVPDGVCAVSVAAFGAQGGAGSSSTWMVPTDGGHTVFMFPEDGGKGAEASSTFAVTPGESLQVNVGGKGDGVDDDGMFSTPDAGKGGWNGGADGGVDTNASVQAGGGGGASDVRRGGTGLANRVVVAGGGGGTGAGSGVSTPSPVGGVGGNPATDGGPGSHLVLDLVGLGNNGGFADPIPYGTGAGGGHGASSTAGGAGGSAGVDGASVGAVGAAGMLGVGGKGAVSTIAGNDFIGGFTGGGGGGGLYGGGGGGAAAFTPADPGIGRTDRVVGAGGGGGSSLGDLTTPGVHEGDGQVTITPIAGDCHAPATTVSPNGATAPTAVAVAAKPTYTG